MRVAICANGMSCMRLAAVTIAASTGWNLRPFPISKSRADQCRDAAIRVCHGVSLLLPGTQTNWDLGLRPSEPLVRRSRAAPLYSLGLSGAAAFWVARVA
jgi:hypothetical protein